VPPVPGQRSSGDAAGEVGRGAVRDVSVSAGVVSRTSFEIFTQARGPAARERIAHASTATWKPSVIAAGLLVVGTGEPGDQRQRRDRREPGRAGNGVVFRPEASTSQPQAHGARALALASTAL
jgi:hypothetical protein